jgi:hypothetical protein
MHSTDGCTKERRDFVEVEASRAQSTKTDHAPACVGKSMKNEKNMLNISQCNPSTTKILSNLGSSNSTTASVKLKSHGHMKNSFSGSSNFFDR